MKYKELKEKSVKDLNELLKEKREQSRSLRFSISSDQEKHVRKARVVKKQIAQILTLINIDRMLVKKESTSAKVSADKEK